MRSAAETTKAEFKFTLLSVHLVHSGHANLELVLRRYEDHQVVLAFIARGFSAKVKKHK